MDNCLADPRPQAAATLRRAISETFALGYVDISRSLETLLERLGTEPRAAIRVEAAGGRVTRGGRPVALTNRETELCLALGVHRRPMRSEALAALLFPDLEMDAALNRVKVYVHRVREKVAPDVIACTRSGYQLRDDITSDVSEYAGLLGLLAARPFLSDADRAALRSIVAACHETRNASSWRWQWFGPFETHIAGLAAQAAARLAADAFERSATDELLDLARVILQNDPCNEQGCEIAIKAHLAAGRREHALAEFKRYETALNRELSAAAPVHLRELVEIV